MGFKFTSSIPNWNFIWVNQNGTPKYQLSDTYYRVHKCIDIQECIPVGCVPPAHWPYLVVSYAHQPGNHAHPPGTMHALGNHACPPEPCTPPSNHTCPPGNHACPPATMHTPWNHACPPATTHTPQQPHTPPGTTYTPGNHAYPPCEQNDKQV